MRPVVPIASDPSNAGEPHLPGEPNLPGQPRLPGEPSLPGQPPLPGASSARAEPPLSAEQIRSLRCLAGAMIPADVAYDVPGADDDAIFADMVSSIGPDANPVGDALRQLDALAGRPYADLEVDRQQAVARAFRSAHPLPAALLAGLVVTCYYRDDRVMRSLGMEPRPPFPQGFELDAGDWSLLDPVRARPKMYRGVP